MRGKNMFFGNSLLDNAVLQRNADGVSEYTFTGTCGSAGRIFLTVRSNGSIVPGFNKKEVGFAARGTIRGVISGLPAGGPYTLDFSLENSCKKFTARNVLVGDLWVLAGQSNMEGCGSMPQVSGRSPRVRCFYMDNHWDTAKEPLHDLSRAAAPVHGGDPANPVKRNLLRGTGPGISFGLAMYEATGVPQGLIACAHGGTSMAQWDPAKRNLGGNSLYGAMYERVKMLGGSIAGVLWYQGCAEASSDQLAGMYKRSTMDLFKSFRRDFNNSQLPIVLAQLGPFIQQADESPEGQDRRWLQVRNAQYQIGLTMKNVACVPTIDLGLDDLIHLSNYSVDILGRRMADAMLFLKGKAEKTPPIKVKSISYSCDRMTSNAIVTVKFQNVIGKLTAAGLPDGFCMVTHEGNFHSNVVKTILAGDKAVIYTRLPLPLLVSNTQLAYGGVCQPHANITDESGRSVPCFVLPIKRKRSPYSNMLTQALLSEAVYVEDDSLENLIMPESWENIKFNRAQFSSFYMLVPRENGENVRRKRVYYFRFKLACSEAMKLRMLWGSDGDFALYCNQQEIMRSQTANPIVMDEFKKDLSLASGEHEFCCVLSGNKGLTWGICCRFLRLDGKVVPEFIEI